ncbi:MAG: hypothetical protein OEM50_10160 [Gammaproteobacteria bacterium]|nr:hypothetical protein [Gammaproteobacteria bacterium]MDH3363184.1 hypothetical protein [Gammaproteobacteria bacterium]MDH3482069.1 hypothetical protein [Gammaproteobacteria bacterium]
MRSYIEQATRLLPAALVVAALSLAGCSVTSPPAPPTPIPEPVESAPDIVITPPPPVAEPKAKVKIPVPAPLPPVAIVLTSRKAAYADVAEALVQQFENHTVYDLSNRDRPPVTVLRMINDSDSGVVVAIGLRAAKSSVAMSNKPVVFSQVFNYQDHGLMNDNTRGVAAVPPLDAQLAAWKEVDPTLSRIGAIIGDGHEALITEAEIAAERHGVDLDVHVTRSDQETLYFFKRMIRDIDGFWLFPDNRVLSGRALQQIMDDAQRQRVPVLVPSEAMLQMGASISISSVASDIAATITTIVRQIQAGDIAKVPPLSPLSAIRVQTNEAIQVADQ